MKKEDLGALKSLYEGIFSENPSDNVCDKPTVSRTITNGLGIYESQIKSVESKEIKKETFLSEEVAAVKQIVSTTPSTTPLRSTSSILGNSEWGSKATIKDISELYTSIYEEKKKDQDKDGDNDFDDVRIARMIASGMSKEEAMRKVKEDPKGDEVTKEEVEQIDEVLGGQAGDGYIGHPRLGIKNPMAKKQSSTTTSSNTGVAGKLGNRASQMDAAMKQLRQSFEPEGEMVDEAAKRTPKKKRGEKDPVAYMKGRSDAGKRISGDEDTGPRYYTLGRARGAKVDSPTQPGQRPVGTPKLAGWEKDDIQYRKANLKAGKTHKVGSSKGLPEDTDLHKYQQGHTGLPEETIMSEDYQLYEVVSTYLLENNFAEDIDSANAIIENMSPEWVEQVVEEYNEYVEDYNLFVEEMVEVGVDLDEWSDEELEEAYKKLPFRKMVKQAKKTGKSLEDVMKVARDHEPSRAKGRAHANKLAGAITGGRKADRKPPKGDKSKDEPGGYGDLSKYTGDIYAKKFKPGKSVPKVMKFGRPFGKYQPRNIKFGDIKKMGLD